MVDCRGRVLKMSAAFVEYGFRIGTDVHKGEFGRCVRRRVGLTNCKRSKPGEIRAATRDDGGKGGRYMVLTETGGTGILNKARTDRGRRVKYTFDESGRCESKEISKTKSESSSEKSVRSKGLFEQLLEPLLPANWERCTPATYIEWVIWRIGRHVFRKAYYVLGTTSLLMSLGVGSKESIAISASLKWVLKDGVAMGTRLFVSTNLARLVDESPKRFFFIGDSLKALSVGVEILSLTNRGLFLLCGSAAALLRDAGGAMSSPSYRVFLDAFALCGNIGDVSSRSEGQEVVGDLIGLGLGVTTAWTLNQVFDYDNGLIPTLICYGMLVILHLSCTARAISLVDINTLNLQRVDRVLDAYFNTGCVPPVAEVNRSERFVAAWEASEGGRRTLLGRSVGEFHRSGLAIKRGKERGDQFAVVYESGKAGLLVAEEATVKDVLTGTLQARKLVQLIPAENEIDSDSVDDALKNSYEWAVANVSQFMQALNESGWSTDQLMFGRDFRYRYNVCG